KSKVMELEQPGIHMLIDEKLDAELSAYFSFNGYPGYAFISKDGKYQAGSSQYVRDMTKETLTSLVNK
ncbi:MAG TPA: hypothetical protein VHE54_19775, partial [Puia sp.]|nr:hypothetical protein [Puia sp.]